MTMFFDEPSGVPSAVVTDPVTVAVYVVAAESGETGSSFAVSVVLS